MGGCMMSVGWIQELHLNMLDDGESKKGRERVRKKERDREELQPGNKKIKGRI